MEQILKELKEETKYQLFHYPETTKIQDIKYLVKRVIGLPGETVYIDEEGRIYIDDELLEEDFGKEVILSAGMAREPITLGPDEYFVLGDNRNESLDSRDYMVGNIRRDEIIGRAWVRIYPFDQIGFVPHE